MRLRHTIGIASVVALVGGGVWFFVSGTSHNAVGAGGLPLIKADTSPVKLPPEEPGGEVMPNADSTVFSAMGTDGESDPSMENLKLPTPEKPENTPEFAGLKTGFAVPVTPPKTTESLFGTTTAPAPVQEPAVEPAKTTNDYISGIAPNALVSAPAPVKAEVKEEKKIETPAPAPVTVPATNVKKEEPVKAEVKKEEPAKTVEVAKVMEETPPAPTARASEDSSNPAQAMEEQEKAIITPAAKPVVPPAKPVAAKAETKAPAPVIAEEVVPAAAPKAPAPEEKTVASTSSKPGYYMQLASTPSVAEAPKLWAKLQGKYATALSGLKPVYQTATVPGKGEYIRVQAGPLTQQQATDRCKQLREVDAKGGCLVFKR